MKQEKLKLNKLTVANLTLNELDAAKGGDSGHAGCPTMETWTIFGCYSGEGGTCKVTCDIDVCFGPEPSDTYIIICTEGIMCQ